MRSNMPEPFGPVRRSGCRMRCGPLTKAPISRATLLQMTSSVYGSASEPRTLVTRPSSTVTLRLHVSGQSSVHTLARSMAELLLLDRIARLCGRQCRLPPAMLDQEPGNAGPITNDDQLDRNLSRRGTALAMRRHRAFHHRLLLRSAGGGGSQPGR